MSIRLNSYVPIDPLYVPGGGSQRAKQRFFHANKLKTELGVLPHEHASETGAELDTDSTKKITMYKPETGKAFIVKEWNTNNARTKMALAMELLGGRLVSEIKDQGNRIRGAQLFTPGRIGYETDDSVYLVTEVAYGPEAVPTVMQEIPTQVGAKITSTVVLPPILEFPHSSILVEEDNARFTASTFDFETISLDNEDFLPHSQALETLSALLLYASNRNEGTEFIEELSATGESWLTLLCKREYKQYLKEVIEAELGDKLLKELDISSEQIVDHLLKSAEYHKEENSFNPWKEITDPVSPQLSQPRIAQPTKIDEQQQALIASLHRECKDWSAYLKTIIDNYNTGVHTPVIGRENTIGTIKRSGHSISPLTRIFPDDTKLEELCKTSHEIQHASEKVLDTNETPTDELIELAQRYMTELNQYAAHLEGIHSFISKNERNI